MPKQPSRAELITQVVTLQKDLQDVRAFEVPRRMEIEHALRERVKELDCLYTISKLRERYLPSVERFLQGVAECLPISFQYPEEACARIVCGDAKYVSEGFRESPWRIAQDVKIDGRRDGVVEVFYRNVPGVTSDDPFLREEYALISAVAERIGSTVTHMKAEAAVREAHKALQYEHQALQETNIALKAVLSRLEDEKREIRSAILSNIQKILMPIVFELELEVSGQQRALVTLLRQNLQEIASPFLTQICRNHAELTPVEVAISTMIRNGLSTKEIAQIRSISQATVRRHRENIRRKLGLRNRGANLVTFLQSSAEQPASTSNLPTRG